jgi:S-adenosylmethionine synthetase
MLKTSEWVSLGHPDKVADYISCRLLDQHLALDPYTRFAVEVQIKDRFVTLGGEVTSKADFSNRELAKMVREAVSEIGYTREYLKQWGKENTIAGDDLVVAIHIGRQSPDIAQGVDHSGWGDQGIFWGMAVASPETSFMPRDHFLAAAIGRRLFNSQYAGLDIKTQVTMSGSQIKEIVVAIPMTEKHDGRKIAKMVTDCVEEHAFSGNLVINGTGRYVRHGPVGDCGTTGRKLAVDFYGGNCRIGGGSPWTKDGTKADLSLNLLARKYAIDYLKNHEDIREVHCVISCRIGSPEILVAFFDSRMRQLSHYRTNATPAEVIERFDLRSPRFGRMCREGLLHDIS